MKYKVVNPPYTLYMGEEKYESIKKLLLNFYNKLLFFVSYLQLINLIYKMKNLSSFLGLKIYGN